MTTEVAKTAFGSNVVLSAEDILAGLTNTLVNAPTVESKAGIQYAKMRGDDDWVIGRDAEPVEEGDQFVVIAEGFTHGLVAWHGGRPEFQEMIPVNQPISAIKAPDPATLKAKHGIENARGMMLAGTGAWAGEKIDYSANSRGGREAIEGLMKTIRERIAKGEAAIYPVIELKTEGYMHSEHGWIVKPVFDIVEWVTRAQGMAMAAPEGVEPDTVEPEQEPEPEVAPEPEPEKPATAPRRRRAAK